MSHFAKIDKMGKVLQVVVAEPEYINSGRMGDPKTWVQTSYNGSIRKNYAGIGYVYDKVRDAFIPPKKFDSWVLDEATCQWKPPKEKPSNDIMYFWDENVRDWVPLSELGTKNIPPLGVRNAVEKV